VTVRSGWPPFQTWQKTHTPDSYRKVQRLNTLRQVSDNFQTALRPAVAAAIEIVDAFKNMTGQWDDARKKMVTLTEPCALDTEPCAETLEPCALDTPSVCSRHGEPNRTQESRKADPA